MGTFTSSALRSALLLSAMAVSAFAKPNLSGTWKLDVAKSEFGSLPAPATMTRVITHADPSLTVKTTQSGDRGPFTSELKYTTDGKESVNATRVGEVKSFVAWDGDTLVVKYKVKNPNAGEFDIEERWDLTDGGKGMVVTSKLTGGPEPISRKLIFTKE